MNLAICWFIGYGLHEGLPDQSSLTRIRQRWGETRFGEIFKRTVTACLEAKIATAKVVHIDASLIWANVSWDSLSDERMEFRIRDRLSWLRSLGFELGAPTRDRNTIRTFRERLAAPNVCAAFHGGDRNATTPTFLNRQSACSGDAGALATVEANPQ